MKTIKDISYIIIFSYIYWYIYTLGIYLYGSLFFSISPEFTFIYGFISIFIYGLVKKFNSFDCILSYSIILYMVIKQYIKVIEANIFINNEHWYINNLIINIKILLFVSVFIILLFMFMLEDKNSEIFLNFELLILILLCMFGILIIISSNNLFVLYLGIELQSLSIYILCCLKRYSNKSLECGLKYFIFGSYASLILLWGISFIYLIFGTLNFNELNLLINTFNYNNNLLLHLGLICIIVGFFFKLAIAPFHWWLPDIFEGSPDIITFFLAIIPKLPLFFILYRLNLLIFSNFIYYSYFFIICGILSISIGIILALYVVKLKKLLAYSSIVHMGYMLIALSLNLKISAAISFYYFLIYILSTINIFSIYLLIKNTHIVVSGNITDLAYLKNSNKFLSIITIISLFSLAGIPPFMGFYGKLLIFNFLMFTGNYIICFILLILSIASCIYYIRLIRFIYFDDKFEEPIAFQKKKTIYVYILIIVLFFFNLTFLFFQEPILLYIINLLN